jgi:hypothetical protein
MIYLLSVFAGVIGALVGWAVAVLIAAAGLGNESSRAIAMIGPAGAAFGFFVAVSLVLYIRGGFRSFRDIATRCAALVAALGITVAGAYGLRTATFAHLGINATGPAVEFEIRLPPVMASAATDRDTQVELLTGINQTIAHIDNQLLPTADGQAILKGSVPLEFSTNDRLVVLNLPGQGQRLFKLRLAADPSPSAEFGPWHLVDRVVTPSASGISVPHDAFAIRYRVL